MLENRDVPQQYHVGETTGWSVNHRINSSLPGYVVISSKTFTNDLNDLRSEALCSLGLLFAKVQDALKRVLSAERVYIGRYGHAPGYPIHFHVIPIYGWLRVEELFWKDDRYRLLETFAEGPGETPSDGAELTLFVWREFCERAAPRRSRGHLLPKLLSFCVGQSNFRSARNPRWVEGGHPMLVQFHFAPYRKRPVLPPIAGSHTAEWSDTKSALPTNLPRLPSESIGGGNLLAINHLN